MAVDSDIEGLQRAAAKYLSDLGYDTDWPACLKIPEKGVDPIAGHCRQILFYAHAALEHLSDGNTNDAVWCALRLMKHAMQAEFHGWRSLAVIGQKSAFATRKGNDAKRESAKAKYADWQREYDRLKKINPKLKKTDGARKIAEKVGGNSEYIRHHIT